MRRKKIAITLPQTPAGRRQYFPWQNKTGSNRLYFWIDFHGGPLWNKWRACCRDAAFVRPPKKQKRYEGGVSLTTQKDWQHCSNRFKSGKFAQAKHDASDHKEVVSASVCVCCVCVGGLAAGCLQLDHTTVVVVDRVLNTSIVSRASPRGDKCTDWGFWVVLAVRQRLNTLHFHQNHQTLNSKKVSGSRYIAAFSLTGFCSAVFFQGTSCILSHSVWPCQRKELLLAVTTKGI